MKKYYFLLCGLLVCLMSACSKSSNTDLYQEIKSVDKMVFATMSISKTAKMESSDWYTVGKRIAVYSYDSYMRAYIDLSALQMEDLVFDDDAKTVKVTLPPVVTEIMGRDMEMKKVYDNIGSLRDSLDSKERAEIKEIANASFRKEVVDNPMFKEQLTEAAKRKARKYFETIFEANGYTASVDFKPSNMSTND
ncbi:MAG: DUF4230 domain-containing protein [Muribaculaceae bacterium]|nr:DUF4230 domain-containing protein [Muribaculaceae bacterium]